MQDERSLMETALARLEEFRAALRAFRQGTGNPPKFLREREAPRMRDDAFDGCRVFSDRHEMLRRLASGRIGGEVGVQHGHFSRFILDSIDLDELHLFDMAEHLIRNDVKTTPNVRLHIGDSSRQLATLPNAYFDWLYIDGDHSYSGVRKDAVVAMDKVKPGGTIFFNDYTAWSIAEAIPYGIMPAVNELVNDGLQMIGVALTPTGYFDVALRR